MTPSRASWSSRIAPRKGRVLMNALAVSERFDVLAAGTHDQRLLLYRRGPDGWTESADVALGEGPLNTIVVHPRGDSCELFVGCYSGAVVRVSPRGEVKGSVRVNEGAVKSIRLHPEKPVGVSCCADGSFASWTLDGEVLEHYVGHTALINDMDALGSRLASVGRDFTLKIWDFDAGKLLSSVNLGRRSLKSVCYAAPDVVVVGDYWGNLIAVTPATGASTTAKVADNGISSLCRHGEHVLACSYDGTVSLVEPRTLEVVQRLRAMRQVVGVS
jgi:toxoflavin biosynthesis protein ToxC